MGDGDGPSTSAWRGTPIGGGRAPPTSPALRWSSAANEEQPPFAAAPRRARRLAWLALGAGLLAALVVLAALLLRPRAVASSASTPLRLSIVAPPGTTFTPRDITGHAQFALSPDGTRIAFVAGRPGEPPQIWVRSLESGGATSLPGTEDANGPFWSPDGASLAFVARGKLKRITESGAVVRDLAASARHSLQVRRSRWSTAAAPAPRPPS